MNEHPMQSFGLRFNNWLIFQGTLDLLSRQKPHFSWDSRTMTIYMYCEEDRSNLRNHLDEIKAVTELV